jgi:hypothetical protein
LEVENLEEGGPGHFAFAMRAPTPPFQPLAASRRKTHLAVENAAAAVLAGGAHLATRVGDVEIEAAARDVKE